MTISDKGSSVSSRYTLEIAHSRVRPDVLNFHGREALSEPYQWRIEFTAPQSDLAPEDVLLKYATLKMLSGRVVYGVITRFEWLGTSADQTHYAVTLASRLALLSLTRRCAVYQNLSVPELLEQILRAHGLEGPDFDFRLERTYPQRELITQWRETDLAFIQRILSEVGILVAICVGALVVTLGIPEAIISAFLLIIRLAITAWETLVTILGGGAGAAALSAG